MKIKSPLNFLSQNWAGLCIGEDATYNIVIIFCKCSPSLIQAVLSLIMTGELADKLVEVACIIKRQRS